MTQKISATTIEPTTLECFAGVSESAVPVGDDVLGYQQTGQILLHPPSKTQFRKTVHVLDEWKLDVSILELERAYLSL